MKLIPILISLVGFTVIAAFVAAWIVRAYKASGGTFDKFKAAFFKSATIAYTEIGTFVSIGVGLLVEFAADPSTQSAIQSAIDPKYVPFVIGAFLFLATIARRRTLNPADE